MFYSMRAFMITRLSFMSHLSWVLLSLLLIPVNAFATLTLSSSNINFGNVDVGMTSTTRIVTVTNTDPSLSVSLSSITSTGDFSNTTNCPAALGPGASCDVNVSFSPQASGTRTGLLSIAGDDPSLDPAQPVPPTPPVVASRVFNAQVSLSGVGLSGELSTPTTNIDFGSVSVNGQSQLVSVALTNSGNASLSITGITVTAPFEQTNDCPSTLSAGEYCTVRVNVTPSVSGDTSGSLQINGTNQTGTIQEIIPLAVTGVDVVATITPSGLSFPQTETGATSESLTVTVENRNDIPLAINSITTEGDFTQTNDCGTAVAAAASCEVQVVFAPQSEGAVTGALNIDTASGISSVVLSGMAEAAVPANILVLNILTPYTGGNSNLISASEVIAEACPSGRISDRMQEDCNAVVDAAAQNDSSTASALLQITPESASKANKTARQGGEAQTRNLGSRIKALRAGARGLSFQGLDLRIDDQTLPVELISQAFDQGRYGAGASADNSLLDSRLGVFVTGDISTGGKDETDLESGLDFNTFGITFGADYRITNQFILGGALGYIDSNSELDNDAGEIDTQGYSLSLYGTYYSNLNYFVDFSASYGSNNFDQSRRIDYTLTGLADVNQKLTADYDGDMYTLFVGSGYDFARDAWTFGPRADLEYIKSNVDGFTEDVSDASADGGGWATRVDSTDQKWLTLNLGAKVSYTHSADWGILIPYTRLDWLHEFQEDSQVISAHFVDDPAGNTIRIETDDPDRDYLRLRIGTSAQFQNGTVGFIDYGIIFGHRDWTSKTLSVGLRTEF